MPANSTATLTFAITDVVGKPTDYVFLGLLCFRGRSTPARIGPFGSGARTLPSLSFITEPDLEIHRRFPLVVPDQSANAHAQALINKVAALFGAT